MRLLRGRPEWASQPISVLTRSEQRAETLRHAGVQPLVGHWMLADSLPVAPAVQTVLVSVPHRGDTLAGLPEDSDQFHVAGLKNLTSWLASSKSADSRVPRWIYLSTTGVFGSSSSGEVVNETTPVSPNRHGPQIAVSAEKWLAQNSNCCSSVVLRLAGIYGPERVPMIHSLRSGQPLTVPRTGTLNLIHVTDAARAIGWLLEAEEPRPLYLLSDGQPVPREQFYRYLAQKCGVDEPTFGDPDGNDSRSRRATDKRVDSSLFWKDSGLQPLYRDYREGLQTALGHG